MSLWPLSLSYSRENRNMFGLDERSYRLLCTDAQREGTKLSPGLACGLFCYVALHKIWYGVAFQPLCARENHRDLHRQTRPMVAGREHLAECRCTNGMVYSHDSATLDTQEVAGTKRAGQGVAGS